MTMGIALALIAAGLVAWYAVEKRRRRTGPVPPGYQADVEFPHDNEWVLYHNVLSLCSMKTRVCLAELGIDYESQHVELVETGFWETVRPRLLRVNPAGTVPVLLHHGHPIYESHEQIRYAAEHAPAGAPSLVPDDPVARAEMEAWVDKTSLTDPLERPDRCAGNAIPAQTVPLFATMMERIPLRFVLEGLLFHREKQRPLLFLMVKLRGIHGLSKFGPVAKAIRESRAYLMGFLDELETHLEKTGGPWILGDQFTLADVGWVVIFERMRQASCDGVFLAAAERPQVAAYWARIQARPAYRAAILDHRHPLIDYGRERIVEAKAADVPLRVLLEGA